mmetsp:Transcript_11777/g.28899  ORF Transcript_11777/g.28899 Transcript_11777/m.28899 type:complete len:139 (+) Transcript_11777:15-431(+)
MHHQQLILALATIAVAFRANTAEAFLSARPTTTKFPLVHHRKKSSPSSSAVWLPEEQRTKSTSFLSSQTNSDDDDDDLTTKVGSSEYYRGFVDRSLNEEPVERVTGDAILGPTLKFAGGAALILVALTVAFLASNGII